jgi:hypothetical protein
LFFGKSPSDIVTPGSVLIIWMIVSGLIMATWGIVRHFSTTKRDDYRIGQGTIWCRRYGLPIHGEDNLHDALEFDRNEFRAYAKSLPKDAIDGLSWGGCRHFPNKSPSPRGELYPQRVVPQLRAWTGRQGIGGQSAGVAGRESSWPRPYELRRRWKPSRSKTACPTAMGALQNV